MDIRQLSDWFHQRGRTAPAQKSYRRRLIAAYRATKRSSFRRARLDDATLQKNSPETSLRSLTRAPRPPSWRSSIATAPTGAATRYVPPSRHR